MLSGTTSAGAAAGVRESYPNACRTDAFATTIYLSHLKPGDKVNSVYLNIRTNKVIQPERMQNSGRIRGQNQWLVCVCREKDRCKIDQVCLDAKALEG